MVILDHLSLSTLHSLFMNDSPKYAIQWHFYLEVFVCNISVRRQAVWLKCQFICKDVVTMNGTVLYLDVDNWNNKRQVMKNSEVPLTKEDSMIPSKRQPDSYSSQWLPRNWYQLTYVVKYTTVQSELRSRSPGSGLKSESPSKDRMTAGNCIVLCTSAAQKLEFLVYKFLRMSLHIFSTLPHNKS